MIHTIHLHVHRSYLFCIYPTVASIHVRKYRYDRVNVLCTTPCSIVEFVEDYHLIISRRSQDEM